MRKASNIIKVIQVQRTQEEMGVTTGIQAPSGVEGYNFELRTRILINLQVFE